MKKVIFILAIFCLASTTYAQVSLIPKAGITISNVAFDDDDKWDGQKSVLGFTGGLGINFALTDDQFLSLQPELLYTQKGFAAKKSGTVDYDGVYKLNYLELPVMLKIGFGGDVLRGYVNLGPSVGYLLNGRVKGTWDVADIISDDIDEAIKFKSDATDGDITELNANRVEIGANFGAGIGVNIGSSALFLDARYNAGLTDFDKDRKSRNQPFYITAGLKIPLSQ